MILSYIFKYGSQVFCKTLPRTVKGAGFSSSVMTRPIEQEISRARFKSFPPDPMLCKFWHPLLRGLSFYGFHKINYRSVYSHKGHLAMSYPQCVLYMSFILFYTVL